MSRAFSSSTAAARAVKWLPIKTSKPVDWIKRGIEEYLDTVEANYPQLASKVGKVNVGEIRGNPHPTPHHKGRNDPFHGSGAIGTKNLKRDDRETSLHIYPNGVVKPTNEKWPTLQVTAATVEELGEDAVWLDPDYCENYALGGSNAGETSGDKDSEGKGKGKAAEDALSSGGGSSGWEWDNEVQMNKRWANNFEAYVYWDESAQAEKYWDGREWKWVE